MAELSPELIVNVFYELFAHHWRVRRYENASKHSFHASWSSEDDGMCLTYSHESRFLIVCTELGNKMVSGEIDPGVGKLMSFILDNQPAKLDIPF